VVDVGVVVVAASTTVNVIGAPLERPNSNVL